MAPKDTKLEEKEQLVCDWSKEYEITITLK